jgi:predicted glutamine amidotransferase
MCRVLGSVAAEPVSLRHELLEAANPLIRQSEHHDSGWGMAAYRRTDGQDPLCMRFPEAAYSDGDLAKAAATTGRMFNVHVRRATIGGLTAANTHPFCLGPYSFSHNGTILNFPRLREPGTPPPAGDTDSEHFFNLLMHHIDSEDPIDGMRQAVLTAIECSPFSGLNFLFTDGDRLYAYRLGVFELHWVARPGQLLVASECLTDEEKWHSVKQDVLLMLDPNDPEAPHAERLVGDAAVGRADIRDLAEGRELRGSERGAFAAAQAARLASTQTA